MKYRKKPIIVDAFQTDQKITIVTLEGAMQANPGDWIITGVHGERYPCKPDIFAETYEPVDCEQGENSRPVVHGRWEPGNPICPLCGESKFKELDADIWADWMPPYCPNCGADMREDNG